jgi:Protein of unknown function (DUF3617)
MMHRPAFILPALIIGAILSAPAHASEHQSLKATPGLWKITYRTNVSGQSDPTLVRWRCISEEQMDNPAAAFAEPRFLHAACKRTAYSETSKSIKWRYTCTSETAILNSQGSITFDKPQHYTGEVKLDGVVMGYPMQNIVTLEGAHRAACTSPED